MKLRTFLMLAAVVALVYAIGLLLFPEFMATSYGMGASASEILLARFFGTELLVVGLMYWLGRDLTGDSARAMITASLVGNAVGVVVSLMGMLNGAMNSMGWSAVVVYLLIGLGFAYFQFMAPPRKERGRQRRRA